MKRETYLCLGYLWGLACGVPPRVPVCSSCREDLPVENFNLRSDRASGCQSYCKRCSRDRGREGQRRLRQDPEYRLAELDRENRRYQRDPDYRGRRIARTRAYHALERGEIRRAPCPCGNPQAEMHHEDYSKPLEVTWLCRACHLLEHNGPDRTAQTGNEAGKALNLEEDRIAALLQRFDQRRAAEAATSSAEPSNDREAPRLQGPGIARASFSDRGSRLIAYSRR